MNIKDADLIQLWRKSDGTFWYINGFGTWTQFVTGSDGDCCTDGTPFIGLEPDDAMPSGGVGRVNFGITTTGNLQTRTEAGVQQFFAPTGNVKVYKALLTQSGTDAPVATVLQNTLGSVSYSYDSVGLYRATSLGLFTANKTIITYNPNSETGSPSDGQIGFGYVDDSNINIYTTVLSQGGVVTWNLTDGLMSASTFVSIEVYP